MDDSGNSENRSLVPPQQSDIPLVTINPQALTSLIQVTKAFAQLAVDVSVKISNELNKIPIEQIEPLFNFFATLHYQEKYKEHPWGVVSQIIFLKILYLADNRLRIYAWEALYLAKQHQTPLPEWAAWEIASIAEMLIESQETGSKLNTKIKQTLQLDGHKKKRIRRLSKDLELYSELQQLIAEDQLSKTYAIENLSKKYGVAESTLRGRMKTLGDLYNTKSNVLDPFSKT